MDCSKCVFAIMPDGPPMSGGPWGGAQTGCEADRLRKFIDKDLASMDLGQTHYQLKQFCNMYRTQKWADMQTEEDWISIATKQSLPSFGVVVQYNEINSQIETTESLKNINYPHHLISIVLSADEGHGTTNNFFIDHVHRLQDAGLKARFVLNQIDETEMRDRSSFFPLMRSKHSYFIKIEQGQKIDPEFFNFINDSQNSKLDIVTFFEDKENGVSAIPRGVIDNTYLEFNNYDLMCEGIKTVSIQRGVYKQYEKKQQVYNQP